MMDAPRDRSCNKNLDSASSSGDQIRTPLPSAASVSTRPPPKNAQERTTKAQKETNEKAQSYSRRFSSGRKRSEDKSISSSSMGTTSQTEVLNKTLSNDVRDDAAEKTREQDGTGKKRKRRPRTRREENCVSGAIKSDHGTASQNGLHDVATGEESRNHGRSQMHEQGHPQEIPEATKSVAVKGIDDTLSKNRLQNDATGEENRSQEDGIEKQRQRDPQNKGGPTTTAAMEGERTKVSQNTMQVGATGEESRKQDTGTQKQGRNRRRNRRAASKSVDAITSNVSTSSQNGAMEEESRSASQDKMTKHGNRSPENRNESNQTVSTSSQVKKVSRNGEPNGATGEDKSQDALQKQGQRGAQNISETSKAGAAKNQEKKVSQNKSQDEIPKQSQRGAQNISETSKADAAKNQEKKLSPNKSQDEIPKQRQRGAQNISETSKAGAANNQEKKLSPNKSQDEIPKQSQRGAQNMSETKKTGAAKSQEKKLSQNKGQDEIPKQSQRGAQNISETSKADAAKNQEKKLSPNKSQDEIPKQSQRGVQNISETSKAGSANNQEKKLSPNKSQDEIPKQSQRGVQNISETSKAGSAKNQEKKLSPNKSQDEIPKQSQRGAQNMSETKKTGAAKSQEKKLSQNKGQGEIPKQSQRGAQNMSETNKAGAAKSQEKKLSHNMGQGEIPKQNQRGVRGISETDKAGAAKSQEKKLSQNKGQGEIPKQSQRGAQNISETKKTGAAKSQEQNEQNGKTNITDAAKSQESKLSQNEPPNCATVKGRSQDNTRKQELRRPRSTRNVNTKVLVKSESALSQTVPLNGATDVESGSQDGTRKGKQIPPRERLKGDQVIAEHNIQNTPSLPNNTPKDPTGGETKVQGRVSHAQDLEKTVQERKCEVLDVSNSSSQNEVQVRTAVNNATESRSEIIAAKDPRSSKRKAKKTSDNAGSQLKNRSLEAMRDLLNKSPEDIVNWLTSEHSFLFKNQHKVRDEAVAVLVKLLAKACDCESHSDLTHLFSILSNSWFLTRRVGPFLDQLVTKKSKKSQTEHLETVRATAKVLTEVVTTFPNACPSLPLVKLHTAATRLANSGKLLDKRMISTIQELMRVKKKEEITKRKQNAVQRSPPIRAAITDDNREPPENFRELSVIPTREDIIASQDQDQALFLRKNKIQGHYNNEEHYLDVQFRLLREDFLRPLRDGIQQLMAMDSDSSSNDRLQDVRVYENVRILNPVCTSNGVAYKIRFDIASFHRVQWENSKRLIFGSLLCLSKDYFKSFAFAIVTNREIQDVRKGEIEVRFVSPVGEAGLRTGDLCQMVESIAFFEAYRPVLEGLKMIRPGEFPLQRYIVKCRNNVQPPAYLTSGDGQHVVFDFSAIMPNEESHHHDKTPSSACVPERRNHRSARESGSRVSVLDPASWPSAKDLELDESQFNALQLALTKEFAVIQGPPGTGKTYIGLKIAKVLLHNNSAWNKTGRPILVVCYTNHALDQFLEGIHAFHPEGIVRVGGRSKSETIQECSLSKLKQDMIEQRLTPAHIREAYGEIRQEMRNLSDMIESHDGMVEELTRNVLHEDELVDYSMTKKHYDSLTRRSQSTSRERRESIIPQWLGLPVQPADPYRDGFAQPLVMFPFNAECWGLEYFSQAELAFISPRVQLAPGVDGTPGGSLELAGTFDSFIEIPNLLGGFADAGRSITLLAFIYPTGTGGPIVSYDIYGCGVQLWHDGLHGEMGVLTACFIRRDLMVYAPPLRAPVLNMNEWNLVGASYDHDTGVARLWHNGNEVEAVPIGKNFDLATQFSIRVGAGASPWLQYYFTGRISHLHIYAEALTADNIRAVGGIQQGRYKLSVEQFNVDSEVVENNDMMEEDYDRGKTLDFNFDADVMQDQRILDTDAVIRFGSRPPSDNVNADDPYATLSCAEEGVQSGNWQFQNPNRIKKKIKRIIRRELKSEDVMSEEEATKVEDVWTLPEKDRWRLYRRWVCDARRSCYEAITDFQEMFDDKVEELKEVRREEEYEILKNADVIGMTTTGAARYHSLLQDLQPAITIVEEAAEVLEAHIVTSLTPGCQHLILIGDHQQLRPNPTVYDLQKNYDLDVSLFERMVTNGMLFSRLSLQHRMRPEIAKMLDHIYVEPKLENHESVLNFENIKGVERNLFFVDHNEEEDFVAEGKSRSNVHEAQFLTALCRYFIQQGYEQEQITVLTAYSGQLLKLRRAMLSDKTFFEGVRVTAVDNFQGEENDIILLSLVRSERIGFLKIANRVCVALSRARKGFYIIGNATLLEGEDPDLWEKVISDMREQGNMGRHLKLVCQNHPQNMIHASCAEDFEDAPEGGCTEICGMELDCGHTCDQFCHPADLEHKERFVCQKPCAKTCDLGHNCNRTCGEDCGPCMVRVPKLIPGCNHEQEIPCSVDPAKFKCMELVSKQAFPCGHVNQVQCSVASSDIVCKEPCGTLECGHPCSGYCNRCQEGRLHLPCQSPCSRTLFCGHKCKDACVRTCPPCSEPCSNYCDHQQCGRHCGHLCQPCTDECTWKCPHQKCTEPCGEICNRPRCDEPCPMQLPCGHSCVGVCGEVCPKLCRVCDEDEFSESEPEAMFVELIDCGHVFEVNMLDRYMDEADALGEHDNEDVEIKYKECPECNTRILYARRYGNVVKKILVDFEAVKRRTFLSDIASIKQIQMIRQEVREIKGIQKEVLEEIDQSITSGRLTSEEVNKCQNQVTFLKFLGNLVTKYKITSETSSELLCKINILTSRIMRRRDCFSEQELKEFQEELSRTKFLACFNGLMTALESKSVKLNPEDVSRVDYIRSALDSGEALAHQKRKDFIADINRIRQTHGLSKVAEPTDCGSELKDMIVKTKTLTQGPWYKCSKGHVYSAAECTEDEVSIKCPDCLAASRRTAQSQQEVVPTPMKLSQLMNMTFKHGLVTRAKRKKRNRPSKASKTR